MFYSIVFTGGHGKPVAVVDPCDGAAIMMLASKKQEGVESELTFKDTSNFDVRTLILFSRIEFIMDFYGYDLFGELAK